MHVHWVSKKIPVVPVSYREKIRIGRSEINFFLNIFFIVLAVFCWAICSRVPTSILTRDAYFLLDEFRQFGSIISVTTDAILARCMSSPQPPGENRVARSIGVEKVIGSVGNRNHRDFFTPWQFNYTCSLVMYCISAGAAGHHWFWQGNSARHPPN
jgi:hypothetical protein